MVQDVVPNPDTDWDKSVVGVEVEAGTFAVTREQIAAFVAAVGETNPLYTDDEAARAQGYRGMIAPPTFCGIFRVRAGLDAKVTYGNNGFHAGQHFDFFEPIYVGDVITAKQKVADIYAKTGRTGTMVFAVRDTTFYNQEGRLVAHIENSSVRRFVQRGD